MKQTVLVTGATGFIGSHLVKRLVTDNYQVVILKRSFSDTKRINDVLPNLVCYDIDLCGIEQPFRDFSKIDAVARSEERRAAESKTILAKCLKQTLPFL
ncbi:NAD-dependent epimerase/dehydratase family protein [Arthrospira platensis SPKY2]